VRLPGFEPGSQAWEARILPLDYNRLWHFLLSNNLKTLSEAALALQRPKSFFFPVDGFLFRKKERGWPKAAMVLLAHLPQALCAMECENRAQGDLNPRPSD
jgi:hypothetical protein